MIETRADPKRVKGICRFTVCSPSTLVLYSSGSSDLHTWNIQPVQRAGRRRAVKSGARLWVDLDIAAHHRQIYAKITPSNRVQLGNECHWPPKALLYEKFEQPCVHRPPSHDGATIVTMGRELSAALRLLPAVQRSCELARQKNCRRGSRAPHTRRQKHLQNAVLLVPKPGLGGAADVREAYAVPRGSAS